MEVKYEKYLIVVIVALLIAMVFVTGVSLILIDVYVEPRPMEERFFVFREADSADVVAAQPAEVPALEMAVFAPVAEADVADLQLVSHVGLLKGSQSGLDTQKPNMLMGQIVVGGEINGPVRIGAEPTPAEMVMVAEVDEVSDTAAMAVVMRPTQTAVPTGPSPAESVTQPAEPTAAPTNTPPPPTAAPTEVALSPTAAPTEPAVAPTEIPASDIYIVRHGDSLFSIATKLGVTKAMLMEVNGLTDQAVIHAGDELKVPDIKNIGVPDLGQIVWPVEARYVIKKYRYGHRAIDIVLPSGSPVVAIAAGKVEFTGWNVHGYGYMVLIDHGNGVTSLYAHNSAFHVKAGDVVEQGQLIADSGNTGNSTMPHLHLEIQSGGQMLNPCLYLPDGC